MAPLVHASCYIARDDLPVLVARIGTRRLALLAVAVLVALTAAYPDLSLRPLPATQAYLFTLTGAALLGSVWRSGAIRSGLLAVALSASVALGVLSPSIFGLALLLASALLGAALWQEPGRTSPQGRGLTVLGVLTGAVLFGLLWSWGPRI